MLIEDFRTDEQKQSLVMGVGGEESTLTVMLQLMGVPLFFIWVCKDNQVEDCFEYVRSLSAINNPRLLMVDDIKDKAVCVIPFDPSLHVPLKREERDDFLKKRIADLYLVLGDILGGMLVLDPLVEGHAKSIVETIITMLWSVIITKGDV